MRAHRRLITTSVMITLAALIAGCTSSSNPQIQDPSTSLTSSAPLPTPSTTSPVPTPTWAPPNYGKAYPAVSTYLQLINAYNAALRHPTAPVQMLESFVSGQARMIFVGSVLDERRNGRAFRGTPDVSRVVVKSSKLNASVPEVLLGDCPAPAKSQPWTEYTRASGQPVKTSPAAIPPPYEATVKMIEPLPGGWIAVSVVLNGKQTCTR